MAGQAQKLVDSPGRPTLRPELDSIARGNCAMKRAAGQEILLTVVLSSLSEWLSQSESQSESLSKGARARAAGFRLDDLMLVAPMSDGKHYG